MDARSERVVEVITSVRCICSLILSWADWTEERSSDKLLEVFAIVVAKVKSNTDMAVECLFAE